MTGVLDGPFVILLQEYGADESGDGLVVGEDADDVGAPLDLAVEALDRVGNRYEVIGARVPAVGLKTSRPLTELMRWARTPSALYGAPPRPLR